MLDAASPVPLYHQLAERLFAQIQGGSFGAGEKIPSEHELAERYGVGRPTVRQATEALIQRGVLVRKRGSGTFVRHVPAHVDLFSLAGTLVSFERGGVHGWKSRLLGRAEAHVIDEVDHPLEARRVFRIERLSEVERAPVLLEELAFDAEHFPGFERLALHNRSLSEVVERHYHMRAQSADQSFRVVALDAARAQRLGLPAGAPILRVDRTLHFALAPNAVFARMFCRTDRLVFSQRLQGNSHA
jgi:GntR family transcriptional regulator